MDREGKEELVAANRAFDGVTFSPNGETAVVSTVYSMFDGADLAIYDLSRDTPSRFTFTPGLDLFAAWSPDGESVVWSSSRDGNPNL